MKHCIIADFEWCVTPHPTGDRFQYFNEILSVGAVRVDEEGRIVDRFYSLVLPECAAYLHPVILSSLRLSRDALAAAPAFPEVFRQFLTFVGGTRIFTWGCADRSALLQNLRMKAGYSPEKAGAEAPQADRPTSIRTANRTAMIFFIVLLSFISSTRDFCASSVDF